MKTAIKHENDEFLLISLKHVRFLTRHANPHGTQKLRAIIHENDHKTRKRRVIGVTLKHVSGLKVALNRPGTIKLWAITQENVHKMRKLSVFGHIPPTSIESYGRCKSPWNPKTVDNTSRIHP